MGVAVGVVVGMGVGVLGSRLRLIRVVNWDGD